MFKLELDMHLKWVPPMEEHGPGIILTRTIELPFAPTSGLHLFGTRIKLGILEGNTLWLFLGKLAAALAVITIVLILAYGPRKDDPESAHRRGLVRITLVLGALVIFLGVWISRSLSA